VDHCLKDLSHDQGDPHYQEVSAHDPGGVNGTGSPSHDAGFGWISRKVIKKTNFAEVDDKLALLQAPQKKKTRTKTKDSDV